MNSNRTQHVIIGAGPVATNAIEAIRQFDSGQSEITLVSDEPAHSRMALPYWLAGKIPREHIYTGDAAYFQRLGVQTRIGVRATRIDPQTKTLALSDGSNLQFDKLLIATGASPRVPTITGIDLDGVQPLWTLDHTQRVLDATGHLNRPRVVLVGAGFIGFIVLNAMFKRGWNLAVVEQQAHVLPRMLDGGAARLVESWLAARNVQVHTGTSVNAIQQDDDGTKSIRLGNGTVLNADIVIVATGIRPNLDLVDGTGIQIDVGILVNDRMQTNFPHIYAGGDVAQGPVLLGDRRAIHAIQPTAVDHGRVAGANMAGQDVRYPGSLLMNIVDVCGLQCASFANWNDAAAEEMTISNATRFVYRKLLWRDDQMVGAIFAGRADDMGMLNDVGMVKGILQTLTRLGTWKQYLAENPFDIRRAYIASAVAQKLATTTLLGQPTLARQFHFGGAKPAASIGTPHAIYVGTKEG
jgi:NAD(P)H-nitrite reductase large subunit